MGPAPISPTLSSSPTSTRSENEVIRPLLLTFLLPPSLTYCAQSLWTLVDEGAKGRKGGYHLAWLCLCLPAWACAPRSPHRPFLLSSPHIHPFAVGYSSFQNTHSSLASTYRSYPFSSFTGSHMPGFCRRSRWIRRVHIDACGLA